MAEKMNRKPKWTPNFCSSTRAKHRIRGNNGPRDSQPAPHWRRYAMRGRGYSFSRHIAPPPKKLVRISGCYHPTGRSEEVQSSPGWLMLLVQFYDRSRTMPPSIFVPLFSLILLGTVSHAFAPATSTVLKVQRDTLLSTQQPLPRRQVKRQVAHPVALESHNTKTRIKKTALSMALVPLPTEEMEQYLAVGAPTGEQYATYWGRTPQERYGRALESSIVGFLGVFFSYFLSFVMGGFVATILGTLFFFWGILSPQFKATQRNWEFLGGRQLVDPWKVQREGQDPDSAGLYGALYLGFIDDVCVVEKSTDTREYDLAEFDDYTMETDELAQYTGDPYLLRVRLRDSKGRELQVHTRMSEEYLDVQPQMPVVAILLSTRRKFDQLAGITDLFVSDADCWIGDYPYLNRNEIQTLLAEDDEIWSTLEQEAAFAAAESQAWEASRYEGNDDGDSVRANDNDNDDESFSDPEKVRIQRRSR